MTPSRLCRSLRRSRHSSLAPGAVIEQGGEYCAIPHTFQGVRGEGLQQPPRLGIAKGRGAAFVAQRRWALHSIDRIAKHGVALAEIVKQ